MHSSFSLDSLDNVEFLPVLSRADCDRVHTLAYKIWNQHYPPIIGQAQVDYMLDRFQSLEAIQAQVQRGMKYYLICCKGAAAGYFALEHREQECFLSKLYVDKSLQRQGIGSRTIAFIQTLTNALPLRLTVNKDNVGSLQFYQAQGFEIIDAVANDIGHGFVMDDFVLELLPVGLPDSGRPCSP